MRTKGPWGIDCAVAPGRETKALISKTPRLPLSSIDSGFLTRLQDTEMSSCRQRAWAEAIAVLLQGVPGLALVPSRILASGMFYGGLGMRHVMNSLFLFAVGFYSLSTAAQPIVYPAKGQSPEQQQKDQAECQAWATQSTGIDPVALAASPVPQDAGSTFGGGERAGGAVRGAAGGALIGAIAGDAGKGAGIGAVTGTMVGGKRAREKQAAGNQQQQAQRQQQLDTYYRAMGACLEGRGYTIK